MEKERIEQIDRTVQTLEELSFVVGDPSKLRIVMLLYSNKSNENKPLSFAEIQNFLGEEYSSPMISYHLRGLEKKGIITNERRLDTSTGKARSSFYQLTHKGKWIAEVLVEIKNIYGR